MHDTSSVSVRNVNKVHKESLSLLERFAVWITNWVGSMGFFLIIFIWTVGWLTWNIVMPPEYTFDPFPGFVLWLFISNMIQIFLMPLIMIGQNLQSRHAEQRAESEYEIAVDLKANILHLKKTLTEMHGDIQALKNTQK